MQAGLEVSLLSSAPTPAELAAPIQTMRETQQKSKGKGVARPPHGIYLPFLFPLTDTFPASSTAPMAEKARQDNPLCVPALPMRRDELCSPLLLLSPSLSLPKDGRWQPLTSLSSWHPQRPEAHCYCHGDSPSPASRARTQPPAFQRQKPETHLYKHQLGASPCQCVHRSTAQCHYH